MKEMDTLRSVMRLSTGVVRLFRNNVGMFWTGDVQRVRASGVVPVHPGDVVIRKARPVACGLQEGSGDLIGWKSVEVTPDMVGQQLAVFASLEVKAKGGRVSPAQRTWHDVVRKFGGLSGVVRSAEEAEQVLSGRID